MFHQITSNQLILGRSSGIAYEPDDFPEGYEIDLPARQRNRDRVYMDWWNKYYAEVFQDLLPYNSYRDAKRHKNLQINDICLIYYSSKIKAEYRLYRVTETYPDKVGIVRTVDVSMRPRDKRNRQKPYIHKEPVITMVGVPRLCLILLKQDQDHLGL